MTIRSSGPTTCAAPSRRSLMPSDKSHGLLAVLLLLAVVGCSPTDDTDPTVSPAPKITASVHDWPPPTPVLNALYLRALNERLPLIDTPGTRQLLFAAARAVCGGWAAGMDLPRVVNSLPPWQMAHRQELVVVRTATDTYCPQYSGRLR